MKNKMSLFLLLVAIVGITSLVIYKSSFASKLSENKIPDISLKDVEILIKDRLDKGDMKLKYDGENQKRYHFTDESNNTKIVVNANDGEIEAIYYDYNKPKTKEINEDEGKKLAQDFAKNLYKNKDFGTWYFSSQRNTDSQIIKYRWQQKLYNIDTPNYVEVQVILAKGNLYSYASHSEDIETPTKAKITKKQAISEAIRYANEKGVKYTTSNLDKAEISIGKGAQGDQILKWTVTLQSPPDAHGISSGMVIDVDAMTGKAIQHTLF